MQEPVAELGEVLVLKSSVVYTLMHWVIANSPKLHNLEYCSVPLIPVVTLSHTERPGLRLEGELTVSLLPLSGSSFCPVIHS